MASKKKSWSERFAQSKAPEVKLLDFDFAGLKRGMTMLVSSPHEVAEYIRSIPAGETRSINELRADLAAMHHADATCPASTPIFLRVVAEAAFEDLYNGRGAAEVVPFWRVVEPGSRLAQKLTCGDDFLRAQREAENRK
jgi:hypothetical protein